MTGIEQIRQDAARRFAELGFPTTRDEDWRFTNIAPIAQTRFSPAPYAPKGWSAEQMPSVEGCRLVFVNGHYLKELSTKRFPSGIAAVQIQAANGAAEAHLARYACYQNQAFVALNTASFDDGAYIEISAGAIVEEPIHLVFLATGGDEPVISHPRSLVMIGPHSQASIVEMYLGHGTRYFTNAVTEIVAGDQCVLDHYTLQEEDQRSFHVASLQVQLGRDVSFSTHSISLGAVLARNEVNAVLGEGTEATVNGFYLVSDDQHVDNHTTIDHAMPHGSSRELYKGILAGKSAAVFNGKIVVRPGAQKTDAKQTNKNLLLSEDATINTKPELQINADDVRCTHGATIGQLDQDAIFYLQSRGIGEKQARDLLTYAFASDVIERIKVTTLRARLAKIVSERLHENCN